VTRIDPFLATLVRDDNTTMSDEEVAASAIVQMTLFIATQVKITFPPAARSASDTPPGYRYL